MNMVHDQDDMYLSFNLFYVLPRAFYVYVSCGFIPSTVWRFSNNFSGSFRCRKLVLNRDTSYMLDVNRGGHVARWAGVRRFGMYTELLAKHAIEPSIVGAGFYSNVFVVPKLTTGLQPILNLK